MHLKKSTITEIIGVLFIISFFAAPDITFAFGEFDPGGSLNPISVKISPSPSMQAQQAHGELSQAIGNAPQGAVPGCEVQYNAISSYIGSMKTTDNSNPHDATSAAAYLNYLNNRYNSCVKFNAVTQTCPVGYTKKDGVCVTREQGCKMTYGQGASVSSINALGQTICGCMSGYQWEGNICVAIPKTNDEICRGSYGSNSVWSGTLNNKGDLICGCSEGYVWNKDGISCVSITQRCQEDFGSKNVASDGPRPGGFMCRCSDGYAWNNARTDCVLITKQKTSVSSQNVVQKTETLKQKEKSPEQINSNMFSAESATGTAIMQGIVNAGAVSAQDYQKKQIRTMSAGTKRGLWSWLKSLFGF